DILREHTLAYIGYPEKATMKNKFLRVIFSSIILPLRLLSSFKVAVQKITRRIFLPQKKKESVGKSSESSDTAEQDPAS
ncbi:MAG: hypothetical protein OEV85_14825, partial [Candidatus Thorarchaeota archaeon]|nr:hypothetical protein [Candidatus Thorarchaeota archaeon]